jgi:AcrR family transcriptional regulator
MPRTSVAELRRGEIVDGAIRLIARAGYEAATMRGLAAELGVSTGTITHWFATKDQVLGAVLDELAARSAARIEAELERAADPREVLCALGDAMVPDTPERADDQRCWNELAARAGRAPDLADRHRRLYAGWRRRMEKAVAAWPRVDAAEWARTYAALLDGLAMHALLHPASITPERMRAAIRAHLDATLR